jgi:hypothetical protein
LKRRGLKRRALTPALSREEREREQTRDESRHRRGNRLERGVMLIGRAGT